MKLVSLENLSKYNELLGQKTVKSVNSVKPDSDGNVRLGTEKSTFNKVEFDTGYFSIDAAKTYSFDLTGSDLENISKENVNIRLVAKVTTAHSGYKVGDIALLTPTVDNSSGNTSGDKIDVCTYVRGNTLYMYSGTNPALSIHNGTASLLKANVQIKAVLTAFVPDDGSILLIAEDQTNTSKLIGLPDGTLTWQDKNISLLSPVHYSRSNNFETSGQTSIKLPSYLSLMVNGHHFRNDEEVTIDIADSANWDSTETDYTVAENRAGKDFYIYAVDDNKVTKSVHIVLSANSTVPTGYTESSSRKIGGFHCLCADVGTPTWINPATKETTAHWLSGYVKGDVLPYSVWDLLHRAVSENEGMVYDEGIDKWVAIYLPSWDGSKLVSVYKGAIVDGTSSMPMHGELFDEYASEVGCKLPSRSEFMSFSKGSNQGTNISTSADPNTTGGHTDTKGRRMISNIGVEDCCGVLWQWSSDCFESLASVAYDKASGNATLWSNSPSWKRNSTTTASSNYYLDDYDWFKEPVYNPNMSSDSDKGSCHGLLRRALLGGHWGSGSICGSRCVACFDFGSDVSSAISGRLVSGARIVNGL